MNELASVESSCSADNHAAEPIPRNLYKTIVQTEIDQRADAIRIGDSILQAESEIAKLEQRRLTLQEFHDAMIAICDRAVLIIDDVRQNMQRRALVATSMQDYLSDEFLRQRSRFARDDVEDEKLRSRLCGLLRRTPTVALSGHLWAAMEAGDFASAELIRFEFQCREDRRDFMAPFETVVVKLSLNDPAAVRERIANIWKAIEKVDSRVADFFKRVQSVNFRRRKSNGILRMFCGRSPSLGVR
jgi:hypothetical protein